MPALKEHFKSLQLFVSANGELEAKMAGLARIYSEKMPISVILKWFPVQPSSQSQHTYQRPCPLRWHRVNESYRR